MTVKSFPSSRPERPQSPRALHPLPSRNVATEELANIARLESQAQSPRAADLSSPLAEARATCAGELDALLEERWVAGDDSVSNRAIAERHLRCDEKTVRRWRDGGKPIPLAALLILPESVAIELVQRVLQRRFGASSVRQLVALQRAIGEAVARAVDPGT